MIDPAATREALVAAATAEMAEKGLDGASLDAICARAGFTRGAFYVHFRDRDDLLVAVVERVLARTHADLQLDVDGATPDVHHIIPRFAARIREGNPAAVGTPAWRFRHTLAACARVPELRKRYVALQRSAVERVGAAVGAGQQAGTVRDDVEANAIAEILVMVSLGINAALELGMAFDLNAGAKALEQLVTPRPRKRR
jgi:TetR/AcrR family transcriptional regulator, transcriptional repressor for nem operon